MNVEQGELHYYTVRGLKLAFRTYGDPGGRRLLCFHGFLDHGASFRFMASHLEGIYVVAPDVRGHGHSSWVGPGGYYHFYDYYDDARALLDHLGWEDFALLGHSMGGSIATGLAALEADRVESVVLLEGMGPPYTDPEDAVPRLTRWSSTLRRSTLDAGPEVRRAGRRVMADVEAAAFRLRALNSRLPPDRARAFAETLTEPVEAGVVWRYDPLHRTPSAKPYLQSEAEAIWRAVTAPVLSLAGAESGWSFDAIADRHRQLQQVITDTVSGAGHNLHHDQPKVVAAAVQAWTDAPGDPLPHGCLK